MNVLLPEQRTLINCDRKMSKEEFFVKYDISLEGTVGRGTWQHIIINEKTASTDDIDPELLHNWLLCGGNSINVCCREATRRQLLSRITPVNGRGI